MEELQHLQEEQQKTLADDLLPDEDEVMESVPSSLIMEMCTTWGKSSYLCKKSHLDTMISNRAVHIYYDNDVTPFRKM